jgi:hypothetical protein
MKILLVLLQNFFLTSPVTRNVTIGIILFIYNSSVWFFRPFYKNIHNLFEIIIISTLIIILRLNQLIIDQPENSSFANRIAFFIFFINAITIGYLLAIVGYIKIN